jgi:hypothetical protein
MAYIGNNTTIQQYAPTITYFNGNGSTTAFTLPIPVASAAQLIVHVENVPQNPATAFTISGSTLTFTSAPPTGTNNIWVEYTSLQTNTIAPSNGTVGTLQLAPLTTLPVVGGYTATLPSATGTLLTTTSNQLCKAWVIFGEAAGGATIYNSYNVSSVTRTGTGLYTITFTTAMPSVNYSVFAAGSNGYQSILTGSNYNRYTEVCPYSASQCSIASYAPNNGALVDIPYSAISVFSN